MKIFKYNIFFDFKIDRFPLLNFRPFIAGFAAVFIITIISSLGIKIPEYRIASFSKPADINILDTIRTKLKVDKNDYKLFKEEPVVSKSFAKSDFDSAPSYISVNFDTGKVISQKDPDKKLAIASLTKIMTAVVALNLANPSDLFTVSSKASNESPTRIGVLRGQKLTLKELLNALLLTSANDAAEVIREGIDEKSGKGTFVKAMNIKAGLLGLKNTRFSNPQGFDSKNNYSSASDLAVLSHFAITTYPLIAEIVKKDYEFIPKNENHNFFDLYNWNGLLGVYPNILGLKIGNTDSAGYTTIVLSDRNGEKVLAVLLGAPGIIERDLWASELLDYSFENTLGLPPVAVNTDQLMQKYGTWKYFN